MTRSEIAQFLRNFARCAGIDHERVTFNIPDPGWLAVGIAGGSPELSGLLLQLLSERVPVGWVVTVNGYSETTPVEIATADTNPDAWTAYCATVARVTKEMVRAFLGQ